MATHSSECKACGCGLNHADVRQLALYYRQEQPSLVAVQYVCPRCGHTEWRHQRPTELEREGGVLLGDWAYVAQELGLMPAAPAAVVAAVPGGGGGGGAITLDEYIDFGRRLARLTPGDLQSLHDPA